MKIGASPLAAHMYRCGGVRAQVASSSGPTHESGGDVPVVLDTLQSMGSTKRRVPMQCQVCCPAPLLLYHNTNGYVIIC